MKTILYKIFLVVLMLPAAAIAGPGNGKYAKEKKISKTF